MPRSPHAVQHEVLHRRCGVPGLQRTSGMLRRDGHIARRNLSRWVTGLFGVSLPDELLVLRPRRELTPIKYSIIHMAKYGILEYWNMAKAHITTKAGTKVTIEGTPDEVAKLVGQFEGAPVRHKKDMQRVTERRSRPKTGPINLLAELIDGGFFKKPRELSAIRIALEEQGHFYPVTSLSPTVLRLVRKRELRRIKDKSRWLYVR